MDILYQMTAITKLDLDSVLLPKNTTTTTTAITNNLNIFINS